MGRRSTFTQEIADEIVTRLRRGEPLAVICRSGCGMPDDDTVRAWANVRPEFAEAIACARKAGFDMIAERTRMTARGLGPDFGGDSTGDVQRDKLVVDTDLKLLSKWDPKGYGDRQQIEHSGSVNLNITSLTDDELESRLLELVTSGRLKLPAGVQLIQLDEGEDDDCPW